jgi:hypothetical protein
MPIVELIDQVRIEFECVEGDGIRNPQKVRKAHKQEKVTLLEVFLVNH